MQREVKGLLLANRKQLFSFYSRKRCEGFAACKPQAALQILQRKKNRRVCCLQTASSSSASTAERDVKGLLLANRKQLFSFYSRERSEGVAACKRQAALQLLVLRTYNSLSNLLRTFVRICLPHRESACLHATLSVCWHRCVRSVWWVGARALARLPGRRWRCARAPLDRCGWRPPRPLQSPAMGVRAPHVCGFKCIHGYKLVRVYARTCVGIYCVYTYGRTCVDVQFRKRPAGG